MRLLVSSSFSEKRSTVVLDPLRNQRILFFGWCSQLLSSHVDYIGAACADHGAGFIEMGAGSGWLAFLLKDRGYEVDAYDNTEGPTFVQNWRLQPWFKHVQKGSIEVLQHSSEERRTLLLCWPEKGSSFAVDALRAFKGTRFVYVGEEKGGETANDDFFKELTQKWSSVGCLSLCTAADVDKKANNDNASGDAIRIYQRSSLSSSK
mmetsp:Transcript_29194/g.54654  ORF Transcript_29194/g.54654 Transcript_29194/m.54654 type:complete len:206 (-) Transcript_29194:161-778(-)